jgi:hypothetical protein
MRVFGLSISENKEPTSGLEPLTCSLRVSCSKRLNFIVSRHFQPLGAIIGKQGAKRESTSVRNF